MFFSEEKNQKTLIFPPAATLELRPAGSGLHQKQKSFGSFLQKRTAFFLSDFNHLEINLSRSAIGTFPIGGHIFPGRARRNSGGRIAACLVVDPTTIHTHPLLHAPRSLHRSAPTMVMPPRWPNCKPELQRHKVASPA
jgi:hypothetical protein